MSDGRARRKKKQARRDARRTKKRSGENSADTPLVDAVRSTLARGHPFYLLSAASVIIHLAKPDPLAFLPSRQRANPPLDDVLDGVIGVRKRETTALLAVLAELLVDDRTAQIRCRQELAERDDHLPRWITALPQVDVYRAARRSHVLGDVDELMIGMRLKGGHEMTVVVLVDHNMFSSVADAGALADSIDDVLDRAAENSTDSNVVEISLADARASIENALAKPTFSETQTWPHYRALVQWLVGRLPDGGEWWSPAWEWEPTEELCDAFFTSRSAAPFSDSCHRELLLELLETGTGDPLRWSVARVEIALDGWQHHEDRMPLEVALDAPDLLRAFIPFAHSQSGIRDELTSRALAVIDERRSGYKREVLRQAKYWEADDEAS